MFLALELCLTVICVAVALVWPEVGDTRLSRFERWFANFAQRRVFSVTVLGFSALAVRVALLPILPIPVPQVDDEFSHLLLADTLAHGRLANPAHPMWVHFETFFVNWQPTYASMYYPGHALFLALGQVVLGHPFWGVWLSSGLMCAALGWAFQGWMNPGLALLGGALALIRLGTFSYWADSYWGGTVSAFAGALVIGALPRLKATQQIRHSSLMGFGMALLAATRPYEGLFLCVPLLASLVWWIFRNWQSRPSLMRMVVPALCVLVCALSALGYYFWRVTGSPFITPYQLNMRAYGMIYFPWDKLQPVQFHHAGLEAFYRGPAVVNFLRMAHEHPLRLQFLKAIVIWLFYFGPALTIPWVALLLLHGKLRNSLMPEFRFLLILGAISYVAFMLPFAIGQPHYVAPLTVVFYCTTLLIMRALYHWAPTGRFLARSVPLICMLLFVTRVAAPVVHLNPRPSWIRTWCSRDFENVARARIQNELDHTPGMHLIIVRYAPNHDFILDEWVFNNADIDSSKVIWARDMGARNAELVNYFRGRKAWLVEPDYNPPRLTPYAR